MARRGGPKIRLGKMALEIIRAGDVAKIAPDASPSLTREELVAHLENILHLDRLKMTDQTFRIKYVNYIRNYWS